MHRDDAVENCARNELGRGSLDVTLGEEVGAGGNAHTQAGVGGTSWDGLTVRDGEIVIDAHLHFARPDVWVARNHRCATARVDWLTDISIPT